MELLLAYRRQNTAEPVLVAIYRMVLWTASAYDSKKSGRGIFSLRH